MFILYAVLAGVIAGFAMGGRLERLAELHLRWTWLAVGGLVAQVALFSTPFGNAAGPAAPTLYVVSTIAVGAFVARNVRLAGFPIVLAGGVANLVAILANGGFMPADPGALAAAGVAAKASYSNSSVLAHPLLAPLTDIFAMPAGLPFANVFSVGDVLIGAGACVAIALAMRVRPALEGAPA